jgi:hypothetical protein
MVQLKIDKSHTFLKHLVIFYVSLSLRELRGVRMLKGIFIRRFYMESLKFEETNKELKDETTLIFGWLAFDIFS